MHNTTPPKKWRSVSSKMDFVPPPGPFWRKTRYVLVCCDVCMCAFCNVYVPLALWRFFALLYSLCVADRRAQRDDYSMSGKSSIGPIFVVTPSDDGRTSGTYVFKWIKLHPSRSHLMGAPPSHMFSVESDFIRQVLRVWKRYGNTCHTCST